MEITDVRIFLRESAAGVKLKAFATITLDQVFVVRNLKVIEGSKGLFVAMPSERSKEPCPACGHRNVVRSRHCNQCGKPLPVSSRPAEQEHEGAGNELHSEHRDIAHPITAECREALQKKVIQAYEKAKSEGKQ